MPNTDPVLDSAPLLRSLRDTAAREARIPVGFLAAVTRGLEGEQLTEMAELARKGRSASATTASPSRARGCCARRCSTSACAAACWRCTRRTARCPATGVMHEGAISAALGLDGIPTVAESTMVARDAELAGYEGARVHFQHLSCAASAEAVAAAKARGWRVSAEVTPHHLLLTDEAVRGMNTSMKMHPPLTSEDDRTRARRGAPRRHDRLRRHRPRTPRPRGEGSPLRAGPDGHHRPGDGLRRPLQRARAARRARARRARRAHERRARRCSAWSRPTIAAGRPADLVLVDLDEQWTAGEHGWQSRSANCCFSGRRLQGRVQLTLAAGRLVHRDRALALAGA